MSPRDAIYWADMLGSALLGYGTFFAAMVVRPAWLAIGCALVAILALYRAGSFIHELTHIKKGRGARLPLRLEPHRRRPADGAELHVRRRPQPAPRQALLRDGRRSRISAAGADAAVDAAGLHDCRSARANRHADPLCASSRRFRCFCRSFVRSSSAAIRAFRSIPKFVRPKPEGDFARDWAWQEAACSIWAIALLVMVATGIVPLRDFLIFLGVASGVMFLNQVRTLVAHLWENDGEPMSVTAQFLDSVNVPPPATLPALWAPVGLRYHGASPSASGPALSRARRGAPAPLQGTGCGLGLSRFDAPRTSRRWSARLARRP